MQDLMPPITTPDNAFHDGNPATGELGTIVAALWLNNVQGAVRDIQAECIDILAAAGFKPDPTKKQLLDAIKGIVGNAVPAASTTQAGIVKLSSATDSDSETEAATPKAVKAANDNANKRVPENRKINGHELTEDINITSQDIFDGQAIPIGPDIDLRSIQTPGIYSCAWSSDTKSAPIGEPGCLVVYRTAGIMCIQIYYCYHEPLVYTRLFFGAGTWSTWVMNYNCITRKQADALYQPKGNYAPAGQSWTKTESDGRYQPKGNYTPAGQAYTKAESDARYVQNEKLGSEVAYTKGSGESWTFHAPTGCIMTGLIVQDTGSHTADNIGGVYYKPQQIYINGAWRTISG